MCAAVICEVPEECTANMAPGCCQLTSAECTPCPVACSPCAVPEAYPPCSPCPQPRLGAGCGDGGPCSCNTCCYQQPERTRPIRPLTSLGPSHARMETDTIYKRSYYGNCGDCFRAKPVKPCNSLGPSNARMESCTVQRLSYLPPCVAGRTAPIHPPDNGLRFHGPIYAMTSQKHDYVPKGYSRRCPIMPINSIASSNARLDGCTINRLSYLPNDVCQHPPPQPIRQGTSILPATGPIERCTIQKLSYLPVCPAPKDPMPWAHQVRCPPPPLQNCCTVYKLSYLPNCNVGRTGLAKPPSALHNLGTDRQDGCTVYKLSYLPVNGNCCRPQPIRPVNGLCMPTGPMEKCTVQKLSYLPNCVERTMPIRPRESCVKSTGPLYDMTTQKHDYVPKPMSRRSPIMPITHICRPNAGMERCTVNRLSYMPVNVCENPRPRPIIPRSGFTANNGPIEKCTTYKLSYLPNCPAPRQATPWANQQSITRSNAPMEKCTIQRLSYGPPGGFSRCGGCCNSAAASAFPRAGIC